jgi:hypothetical protein
MEPFIESLVLALMPLFECRGDKSSGGDMQIDPQRYSDQDCSGSQH